MKASCDEDCAPANGTWCLTCCTLQLSVQVRVSHTIPALRMNYMTTLKPPHPVVVYEPFQAYGTIGKLTIIDDRWRCRWPET
eukprot:8146491-Pyramimonas_sp.AAC.1